MTRWQIGLLAVLVVAVVGGAGYLGVRNVDGPEIEATAVPQTILSTRGNVQQTVAAPGELVLTRQTVLGFDIAGKLDMLDLRPGDQVRAGQILARLNTDEHERVLEEAQLKLSVAEVSHARQTAEAEIAIQAAQLRPEQARIDHARQITEAEQVLQTTRARLVQARLRYPDLTTTETRLSQARADEAYTRDEHRKALDRPWEPQAVRDGALRTWRAAQDTRAVAEAEYQSALNDRAAIDQDLALLALDVEQAEARLADLRGGSDPFPALDLHKAQEALADLQASGVDPLLRLAVERARANLDVATLIAPLDGVVLEVKVRVGEMINAGMPLIVLADPGNVKIKTSVIEEDIPLVTAGQLVELFFDAAPGAMPLGVVARLVPQRIAGERPLYPVYITPQGDLPDGRFAGMTVDAAIVVAQRTDVLRPPGRATSLPDDCAGRRRDDAGHPQARGLHGPPSC